jgi:hypothetical protein
MDPNQNTSIPVPETPQFASGVPQLPSGEPVKQKAKTWPIILGGLIVLALVVGFIILLMMTGAENVGKIRDIFLIFMALESLIIGIVLVILIVQMAVLINLIQNEIKPILKTTNETVNTLKGTTTFISDNLAEPVIKLNEYLAGFSKLVEVLFPSRR